MDARRRPPTQTYGRVSGQTWDFVRAAYVAGDSARIVCERFGVGEANLRKKARLEGWTKRDWAETRGVIDRGVRPASPKPREAAAPTPIAKDNLMDVVLYRAREALTAGKGAEASALLKALREYIVVLDDVSDAHEAIAWIDDACTVDPPDMADRLTEALAITQLRQMWAPLDADEVRWREEARNHGAAKAKGDAPGAQQADRAPAAR